MALCGRLAASNYRKGILEASDPRARRGHYPGVQTESAIGIGLFKERHRRRSHLRPASTTTEYVAAKELEPPERRVRDSLRAGKHGLGLVAAPELHDQAPGPLTGDQRSFFVGASLCRERHQNRVRVREMLL